MVPLPLALEGIHHRRAPWTVSELAVPWPVFVFLLSPPQAQGVTEWLIVADCKSVGFSIVGSNPTHPDRKKGGAGVGDRSVAPAAPARVGQEDDVGGEGGGGGGASWFSPVDWPACLRRTGDQTCERLRH